MSTPTSTPRSSVVVPGITPLPGYVPTTPITTPRRTPASTRSDRLQRVTFGIRRRRSLGSGSNFASQSFASFTGTDPVRDADEPQLVSQPADVATALEESVFGRSQQHDETPRDPKRMRSTRSFFGAHTDNLGRSGRRFSHFVLSTRRGIDQYSEAEEAHDSSCMHCGRHECFMKNWYNLHVLHAHRSLRTFLQSLKTVVNVSDGSRLAAEASLLREGPHIDLVLARHRYILSQRLRKFGLREREYFEEAVENQIEMLELENRNDDGVASSFHEIMRARTSKQNLFLVLADQLNERNLDEGADRIKDAILREMEDATQTSYYMGYVPQATTLTDYKDFLASLRLRESPGHFSCLYAFAEVYQVLIKLVLSTGLQVVEEIRPRDMQVDDDGNPLPHYSVILVGNVHGVEWKSLEIDPETSVNLFEVGLEEDPDITLTDLCTNLEAALDLVPLDIQELSVMIESLEKRRDEEDARVRFNNYVQRANTIAPFVDNEHERVLFKDDPQLEEILVRGLHIANVELDFKRMLLSFGEFLALAPFSGYIVVPPSEAANSSTALVVEVILHTLYLCHAWSYACLYIAKVYFEHGDSSLETLLFAHASFLLRSFAKNWHLENADTAIFVSSCFDRDALEDWMQTKELPSFVFEVLEQMWIELSNGFSPPNFVKRSDTIDQSADEFENADDQDEEQEKSSASAALIQPSFPGKVGSRDIVIQMGKNSRGQVNSDGRLDFSSSECSSRSESPSDEVYDPSVSESSPLNPLRGTTASATSYASNEAPRNDGWFSVNQPNPFTIPSEASNDVRSFPQDYPSQPFIGPYQERGGRAGSAGESRSHHQVSESIAEIYSEVMDDDCSVSQDKKSVSTVRFSTAPDIDASYPALVDAIFLAGRACERRLIRLKELHNSWDVYEILHLSGLVEYEVITLLSTGYFLETDVQLILSALWELQAESVLHYIENVLEEDLNTARNHLLEIIILRSCVIEGNISENASRLMRRIWDHVLERFGVSDVDWRQYLLRNTSVEDIPGREKQLLDYVTHLYFSFQSFPLVTMGGLTGTSSDEQVETVFHLITTSFSLQLRVKENAMRNHPENILKNLLERGVVLSHNMQQDTIIAHPELIGNVGDQSEECIDEELKESYHIAAKSALECLKEIVPQFESSLANAFLENKKSPFDRESQGNEVEAGGSSRAASTSTNFIQPSEGKPLLRRRPSLQTRTLVSLMDDPSRMDPSGGETKSSRSNVVSNFDDRGSSVAHVKEDEPLSFLALGDRVVRRFQKILALIDIAIFSANRAKDSNLFEEAWAALASLVLSLLDLTHSYREALLLTEKCISLAPVNMSDKVQMLYKTVQKRLRVVLLSGGVLDDDAEPETESDILEAEKLKQDAIILSAFNTTDVPNRQDIIPQIKDANDSLFLLEHRNREDDTLDNDAVKDPDLVLEEPVFIEEFNTVMNESNDENVFLPVKDGQSKTNLPETEYVFLEYYRRYHEARIQVETVSQLEMVGIAIPSVTVPPHVLEMILNRQLFFSNISEGRLRRAHVAFADLFRHFLSYPVEYNDFADTESDDGWVGMEEQEREEYKRKRNSARACKVCSGILHLCTLVCRHFAESNNALAGNHPQPAFFRQLRDRGSVGLGVKARDLYLVALPQQLDVDVPSKTVRKSKQRLPAPSSNSTQKVDSGREDHSLIRFPDVSYPLSKTNDVATCDSEDNHGLVVDHQETSTLDQQHRGIAYAFSEAVPVRRESLELEGSINLGDALEGDVKNEEGGHFARPLSASLETEATLQDRSDLKSVKDEDQHGNENMSDGETESVQEKDFQFPPWFAYSEAVQFLEQHFGYLVVRQNQISDENSLGPVSAIVVPPFLACLTFRFLESYAEKYVKFAQALPTNSSSVSTTMSVRDEDRPTTASVLPALPRSGLVIPELIPFAENAIPIEKVITVVEEFSPAEYTRCEPSLLPAIARTPVLSFCSERSMEAYRKLYTVYVHISQVLHFLGRMQSDRGKHTNSRQYLCEAFGVACVQHILNTFIREDVIDKLQSTLDDAKLGNSGKKYKEADKSFLYAFWGLDGVDGLLTVWSGLYEEALSSIPKQDLYPWIQHHVVRLTLPRLNFTARDRLMSHIERGSRIAFTRSTHESRNFTARFLPLRYAANRRFVTHIYNLSKEPGNWRLTITTLNECLRILNKSVDMLVSVGINSGPQYQQTWLMTVFIRREIAFIAAQNNDLTQSMNSILSTMDPLVVPVEISLDIQIGRVCEGVVDDLVQVLRAHQSAGELDEDSRLTDTPVFHMLIRQFLQYASQLQLYRRDPVPMIRDDGSLHPTPMETILDGIPIHPAYRYAWLALLERHPFVPFICRYVADLYYASARHKFAVEMSSHALEIFHALLGCESQHALAQWEYSREYFRALRTEDTKRKGRFQQREFEQWADRQLLKLSPHQHEKRIAVQKERESRLRWSDQVTSSWMSFREKPGWFLFLLNFFTLPLFFAWWIFWLVDKVFLSTCIDFVLASFKITSFLVWKCCCPFIRSKSWKNVLSIIENDIDKARSSLHVVASVRIVFMRISGLLYLGMLGFFVYSALYSSDNPIFLFFSGQSDGPFYLFIPLVYELVLSVASLILASWPSGPPKDISYVKSRSRVLRECCLLIALQPSDLGLEKCLQHAMGILSDVEFFRPEHIFVVEYGLDDGQSTLTSEICGRVSKQFNDRYDRPHVPQTSVKHVPSYAASRMLAYYEILTKLGVNYKYVVLSDCSVRLPEDFYIPLDEFKNSNVKCLAFVDKAENLINPLSDRLQLSTAWQHLDALRNGMHSMFQDELGSALFCMGAVSCWEKNTLRRLLWNHSSERTGDQLQLGLLLHSQHEGYKIKTVANVPVLRRFPEKLLDWDLHWNLRNSPQKTVLSELVSGQDRISYRSFFSLVSAFLSHWTRTTIMMKLFLIHEILMIIWDSFFFPMLALLFIYTTIETAYWVAGILATHLLLMTLFNYWSLRDRFDLRVPFRVVLLTPLFLAFVRIFRFIALLHTVFSDIPSSRPSPPIQDFELYGFYPKVDSRWCVRVRVHRSTWMPWLCISCGHSDRMYHVSWTVSRLLRLPVSMLRLKGEDGRLIPSYLRVDSAYQNPEIITLSLGEEPEDSCCAEVLRQLERLSNDRSAFVESFSDALEAIRDAVGPPKRQRRLHHPPQQGFVDLPFMDDKNGIRDEKPSLPLRAEEPHVPNGETVNSANMLKDSNVYVNNSNTILVRADNNLYIRSQPFPIASSDYCESPVSYRTGTETGRDSAWNAKLMSENRFTRDVSVQVPYAASNAHTESSLPSLENINIPMLSFGTDGLQDRIQFFASSSRAQSRDIGRSSSFMEGTPDDHSVSDIPVAPNARHEFAVAGPPRISDSDSLVRPFHTPIVGKDSSSPSHHHPHSILEEDAVDMYNAFITNSTLRSKQYDSFTPDSKGFPPSGSPVAAMVPPSEDPHQFVVPPQFEDDPVKAFAYLTHQRLSSSQIFNSLTVPSSSGVVPEARGGGSRFPQAGQDEGPLDPSSQLSRSASRTQSRNERILETSYGPILRLGDDRKDSLPRISSAYGEDASTAPSDQALKPLNLSSYPDSMVPRKQGIPQFESNAGVALYRRRIDSARTPQLETTMVGKYSVPQLDGNVVMDSLSPASSFRRQSYPAAINPFVPRRDSAVEYSDSGSPTSALMSEKLLSSLQQKPLSRPSSRASLGGNSWWREHTVHRSPQTPKREQYGFDYKEDDYLFSTERSEMNPTRRDDPESNDSQEEHYRYPMQMTNPTLAFPRLSALSLREARKRSSSLAGPPLPFENAWKPSQNEHRPRSVDPNSGIVSSRRDQLTGRSSGQSSRYTSKPGDEIDAYVGDLVNRPGGESIRQGSDIQRLAKNRYRILGKDMIIRRVRNNVMVRVGGGYMTVDRYLLHVGLLKDPSSFIPPSKTLQDKKKSAFAKVRAIARLNLIGKRLQAADDEGGRTSSSALAKFHPSNMRRGNHLLRRIGRAGASRDVRTLSESPTYGMSQWKVAGVSANGVEKAIDDLSHQYSAGKLPEKNFLY